MAISKEAKSEYNKKYYRDHMEKEKARKLAWYHENKHLLDKDELKEYHAAYYEMNKDKWPRRTKEQQDAYNATRRAKYAADAEYRERQKAKVKEWQENNPKKRKAQRIRKFGITVDEFSEMMEEQDGKCAICGYSDLANKKFFPMVDHDHATGKVRGLLCSNCNQAIGKMKDNPELLLKAADYIKNGGVRIG